MTLFTKNIIATIVLGLLCTYYSNAQVLPNAYPTGMQVSYVREWIPTVPISDTGSVPNRPVEEVKTTTSYVDGLGRPLQSVTKQMSPLKKDIVTAVVYDNLGRETYKYLPFVSTNTTNGGEVTDDGSFKTNPFQQQQAFMTAQYGSQGETYFYGQTDYEASPLNRPTKSFAAGNSWVGSRGTGNEKSVQIQYKINTAADVVKIWNIDMAMGSIPSTLGEYPTGQLLKNLTIDEANHQVQEFKDKEGKVILKRVQADSTVNDGNIGWLSTYYVYDGFGQLRFVIPPLAVQKYLGGYPLASLSDELCFRYEYDQRHRMIVKKVPGAAEVYMVYDAKERLVMTQDGNLRSSSKWMVMVYDDLNRPVQTGILTDNNNSFAIHLANANNANNYPSTSGWELLTQSYYDDYSWVSSTGTSLSSAIDASIINNSNYFFTSYNVAPTYALPLTADYAVKGMPTGSKVKVLNSNPAKYLYAVIFYDEKGKPIQTQSINITGGKDISTTQFDFSGKPLRSVLQHNYNSADAHTLLTKLEYDHAGRLLTVRKTISSVVNGQSISSAEKTILQNTYDELGQLKTKKLGNKPNSIAALETLKYDYNIRGWLLGVNRDYIAGTTSGAANYFGFELGYDKPTAANAGTSYAAQQYNGNIAGTVWKSKGDATNRQYDYGYDNANRLLKADFKQKNDDGSWNNSLVNYNVKMGDGNNYTSAYDANGNILKMQQWGLKINTSAPIDDLTYEYNNNSNKLKQVTDNYNDPYSKLGDFKYNPSVKTGTDYQYDVNGNMVSDKNKNINNIGYNHLNLPSAIAVTAPLGSSGATGTITYTYDAGGNKLQKTTTEPNATVTYQGTAYNNISITTTTSYITGFVYQTKAYTNNATLSTALGYSNKLQFMPMEEGRIRLITLPLGGQGYAFDYMIKDHLGNVRMVLTDEEQVNQYPAATMETASAATEEQFYANLPQTRTAKSTISNYPTDNTTSPNNYVAKVNGNGQKIGPSLTLKVMAGDKINIKVSSWYQTNGSSPNTPISPLPNLLSALINGISGTSAAVEHGATATYLQNNAVLTPGATNFLNNQNNNSNSSKPAAYLNWILFDEQFNMVSTSSGFEQVGDYQQLKQHVKTDLPINKNGYLYVYVSNSTPNIDVFFDNLQVTHTRSPILEETSYYPFGLTMSGISYKAAGSLENKRKFNDGTELNNDFDINLYETYFRSYDAQIGRFHQIDELADFDFEFSPYSFANNNPISMNDPFGLETEDAGHRKHKETSTPENPKTLDPVVVKGYLKKDHSLASGSVLDNFVTHKKAESDEWSNQRSDYEQKREAGLNSIAAAIGLPSEKSHSFEVSYQANQDYKTSSLVVGGVFMAPIALEGGAVTFGEVAWGSMGADFINQKIIQQRDWVDYNVAQTLTSGLLGGRNLLFASASQASGNFLNVSWNSIIRHNQPILRFNTTGVNSFKAAFIGNVIGGGNTQLFKSLGFTPKISKFAFHLFDGTNGLTGGVISNVIEDKLNGK